MSDKSDKERLLDRLDLLLDRVEAMVPGLQQEPDLGAAYAFRWRRNHVRGFLQPVIHPHRIGLRDLRGIERQKSEITRNTEQFLHGFPANNALLWGSRGTGKSSLIKALLNEYAARGLRLIEVDKNDLFDLPDIEDRLWARAERFILFCDDLSFEAHEANYKALKAMLDGSVSAPPENVLIYATSNRRHLLPEYMRENLEARNVGGEIHHSEGVEEKISLSERFGLWLSFYPFNQDEYLDIVGHWLDRFGAGAANGDEMRKAALQWALLRGSRSGRSAYQFARDWAGRHALGGDRNS